MTSPPELVELLEAARAGKPRAVGRLVSLVENGSPLLPALLAELAPSTGRAFVIGITGPPGVGKSTLTNALVHAFRARGERLGVLAVDPTSPFSGGAVLGDRVRMQAHALDDSVFIRSMATRGHLGGVAAATPQALRVFDWAGCDTVLVETVGVGQSEVEVAGVADLALVVSAPGMGDAIQAAKAGILEIGDVFVVNKADRDGAQALIRDLRSMIALGEHPPGAWKPPVVATTATTGSGVEDLVAAVDRFRREAEASNRWHQRRLSRARREVEALALARLRAGLRSADDHLLDAVAALVRDDKLDPYEAADRVLQSPSAWLSPTLAEVR